MNKTELLENIENCQSKQSVVQLAQLLANNSAMIESIFELMENDTNKKAWKAAWVLEHIYMENPVAITKHADTMIHIFMTSSCNGSKRILGKLLSLSDITGKVDGHFVNTCFELLKNDTVDVAVKVHAMQLIYNIGQRYPELGVELKMMLEEQIPNNTAAFNCRAKSLLKLL